MGMSNSPRRHGAARVAAAVLALAAAAPLPVAAARIVGGAAPSASAVQGAAAQPAQVQNDESASLRQGTIAAIDGRGARVQVQGVWLDLVDGKTQLLRNGRPAGLDTLKAGEAIRFTVVPGGAAPALKVIYVP
jgi:hypothetical protein